MARKLKVMESTDNFDDSHEYRCLRCGTIHSNPVGKFYKIQWSDSFEKNSKFSHLCTKCTKEKFEEYERKYGTNTALIIMCYKLDIPYYYSLYDSISKNNNIFSIGLYMRQLNNKQYQYQDFSNSILTEEIVKTKRDYDMEKEIKWSKKDSQNRDYAIDIIGYDPFMDYPEADRKFLFNQLAPYLEDEDIGDDTYKLSQIIQIVNNNNQIFNCDKKISNLDPIRDANDIKILNATKKDLVSNNDKIAKENEISVKNRSNKDIGRSTLTYLMRDLREKDFEKAEADYYDQLRGEGTQWAANMSLKSIMNNGMFDENDKKEIYETQLELIKKLNTELDEYKEKLRLALKEIDVLKRNGSEGSGE